MKKLGKAQKLRLAAVLDRLEHPIGADRAEAIREPTE